MSEQSTEDYFEPAGWERRYDGDGGHWSGAPNAQLVDLVSGIPPGTALDVGCGEGGDVVWLASRGWRVTGADFAGNGLARAARRAEQAGLAGQVDWWQVDARHLDPDGRTWDLVTSHFLHPPGTGMLDVVRRLATAVAPGGHLLVVGHAPSGHVEHLDAEKRRAMWMARDLLPALPPELEVLVVEQRPRTTVRDGTSYDVDDSTLLARRRG